MSGPERAAAPADPSPAGQPEMPEFAAPPYDSVADLVGDPVGADLRALFAGNQFMVLPTLFERFTAGRTPRPVVFYETLPPGIVIRQLRSGGLRVGSLLLRFLPDVVAASPRALGQLHADGIVGAPRSYASNGLSLLVAQGNPAGIGGWEDLARDGVRVAFPDPGTEGIGRLALAALEAAGGKRLRDDVFVRGRERGLVRLTSIHHRQSVDRLREGSTDVAIVWQTEARYHVRAGRPVHEVPLPEQQNVVGEYAAATVVGAPHRALADALVDHLAGPEGRAVFGEFGFSSPP